MAEIAKLEVLIAGDIKPLTAALNQAKIEVDKFEAAGADAFLNLNAGLSKTAQAALGAATDINGLRNAIQILEQEQAGIIKGTSLWQLYENELKKVDAQLETTILLEKEAAAVSQKAGAASTVSFASVGKSLTGVLGQLRTLAYILPGIGIAGIFNIAFEAIAGAADELFNFGKVAQDVTDILKEQNTAFAENLGNATEELVKVQALIAAAKDENLTREERNSALKNAQELYPNYLNSLTLEKLKSQEANDAINQLTGALVRKAKAEALAGLVSQTYAKIVEAQNQPLLENLSLTNKVIAALKGFVTGKGPELVTESLEKQATTIEQLQSLLDSYIKQFNELTVEQAGAGDFIKDDDIEKLKKKKKEVISILQDLNTNIKDISGKFINQIAVETGDVFGELQKEIDKVGGIKIPPLEIPEESETIKKMIKDLGLLGDAAFAVSDAFGGIFKTLITQGRLSFKTIENAIGSLIAKLVEAVVESAILAAILSAFSGGALSFGSAFGQLFGLKNLIPHAEGGIFTQPTLIGNHVFGEKGPEALIPLSQLSNMLSGMNGTQRIEVVGRISGSDIILIQNRQNLRNNRNFGSNFSN